MKNIAAISVSLFMFGATYAQSVPGGVKKTAVPDGPKNLVAGSIRDMRNKPIKGVQAFVYRPDSAIIASGYTDSIGRFKTNSVAPGVYFVKIVYPSTRVTTITGVNVGVGTTEINLRTAPPEADTFINYDVIAPKTTVKKQ